MKATKLSVMALIALGSVMALAPLTRAQEKKEDDAKPKAPQRERGPRPQDRMKRIAEELKLTEEQKPKFEAAMKEYNEKIQELRQNTNAEERRAKLRELRQNLAANMKQVLDADQFEKWEKMQQAARARGARGKSPAGENPPGDKPSSDK